MVREGAMLPLPPQVSYAGKMVTMHEEKAKVLKNLLPQCLMATSLPTPLEWMDSRMGTREPSPSHGE